MTNATFPFYNVDMTKVIADFDPVKIVDQFTKIANTFQVPQFDVDTIIVAQRKNIEAMTATNKAAVENVQALAVRQSEILQETLKEATDAVSELSQVNGQHEATVKQAELLRASFERARGNIKELTELMARSNAETSEAINARISEFLGEFKDQVEKAES